MKKIIVIKTKYFDKYKIFREFFFYNYLFNFVYDKLNFV